MMRRFCTNKKPTESLDELKKIFANPSGGKTWNTRNRQSLDTIFGDQVNTASEVESNQDEDEMNIASKAFYTSRNIPVPDLSDGSKLHDHFRSIGYNAKASKGLMPNEFNWMEKAKVYPGSPESKYNFLGHPKREYGRKPVHEFLKADQDPVELALNPDLLRLFVSPNGRIQARRFTGLNAKQQRTVKRAIKASRNLGLLPYLSQYIEPTMEQVFEMADQVNLNSIRSIQRYGQPNRQNNEE